MRIPTLLLVALALGCSDDLRCGDGTEQAGDRCVSTLGCGPSTTLTDGLCAADLGALCGLGTRPLDGRCVIDGPVLRCGAGTTETDGLCLAPPGLRCGPDTQEDDGQCLASLSCGPGTAAEAGRCVPTAEPLLCGEGAEIRGGVCVPLDVPPPCGEGTEAREGECTAVDLPPPCGAGTTPEGGECVPLPELARCGAGTEQRDGACVPVAEPLACGPGTEQRDGACVPVAEPLVCGPGTEPVDGACVPVAEPLVCGPGTEAVDGVCEALPQPARCGAGTVELDGVCVPGPPPCGPGTEAVAGICQATAAVCGAGTLWREGHCEAEVVCGPGTLDRDGQCLPAEAPLRCGDDTVALDGVCQGTLTCGPGTRRDGERCLSTRVQAVVLPFADGTDVTVSQGHFGYFSHSDRNAYAVDFPVAEGTPVLAARGGTVQQIRANSNVGCPDARCAEQANYVVIDHGDGTLGAYWHLQLNGVDVAAGETVCAGQPIGRTGNTGFTSGPHLHFAVTTLTGYTLPLRFEGLEASGGVPYAGTTYRSTTQLEACEASAWSSCDPSMFVHHGVLLDPDTTPCAAAFTDVDYAVTGTLLADTERVLLGRYNGLRNAYEYTCVRTVEAGSPRFELPLRWAADFSASYSYLIIAAAEAERCQALQGWDTAPFILLQP